MTQSNVEDTNLISNLLDDNHRRDLLPILAEALRLLMEVEVSEVCGAGYRERTDDRQTSRNGYRQRPFESRLGSMTLHIPKLRQGSYLPSFVEPRRRWEQAFVNVVAEAYVKGVSTRSVEALVEAMGAKGMSKSEVSRMAGVLDEQVEAFRNRELDKAIPYMWLDGLYIKVRENNRVVSRAVLVAIGVNEDGEREVLGVTVADSEMESSWRGFLRSLLARGLHGVELVMSDAHEGLKAAIRATLNGVTWQRCYVHFIRNVLNKVPKSAQGFVAAGLRNVFAQTSLERAKAEMGLLLEMLEAKFPRAAEVVRGGEDDVLAYYSFPQAHWKQIRSTNPLERLNKELRRRIRVVGIFPTEASVIRLVGMMLVEQDDEWRVGRRYFSASSMEQLGQEPPPAPALEDHRAAK